MAGIGDFNMGGIGAPRILVLRFNMGGMLQHCRYATTWQVCYNMGPMAGLLITHARVSKLWIRSLIGYIIAMVIN